MPCPLLLKAEGMNHLKLVIVGAVQVGCYLPL